MNTRRSPRNQERLWRELGGRNPQPAPIKTIRCWDCASYPKGGRVRGRCALKGQKVNGATMNMPCFRARASAPRLSR